MCIEACGDEDHLRPELLQCRQPMGNHSLSELDAAAVSGQRHIDHTLTTAFDSAVGIKRVLERRHHEHTLVVAEDIFRPVAVMDIEIDDRHTLDGVFIERMRSGNRNIVEDAESHRSRPLGVMPGRTHAAESAPYAPGHDFIDSEHACPSRAQRSIQRMAIHGRVGIEMNNPLLRRDFEDGFDEICAYAPARGADVGLGRIHAVEVVGEPRCDQLILDRAQPGGAFG